MNRRHVLKALAASTLPGCDRVRLEIEESGILLGEDGKPYIPPISEHGDFYVYQCCLQPGVTDEAFRCLILDRGAEVARFDVDFLATLTPVEVQLTLQCIGSSPRAPLINNAIWGGVPLSEALAALGVTVGADIRDLRLVGYDDYDAWIPAADLADAPVWLIWQMNGEPLPNDHGGPARLMVPGRYGVKNVKWIKEIEFLDAFYEDFWTYQGWEAEAVYKANGFILVPGFGEQVERPVYVVGTAFAGKDPVVKVEVTQDGGASWTEAVIDYSDGPNVWALWSWAWDPEPGTYEIQVRVTTASGAQSKLEPSSGYGGYDAGAEIIVDVI